MTTAAWPIDPLNTHVAGVLDDTARLLEAQRQHGGATPIAQLASVPGIGTTLARRLRDEHGIATLEQLEVASVPSCAATIAGFGPKRISAIADVLATRLGRRSRRGAADLTSHAVAEPSVAELLEIDREYREQGEAGTLPLLAPRRFNPMRARWLPILHATKGTTHYTALYSTTARAHERGKTHDWVVIYFEQDGVERQRTVVGATSGPLAGRRVVRGREIECARYDEIEPIDGVAKSG